MTYITDLQAAGVEAIELYLITLEDGTELKFSQMYPIVFGGRTYIGAPISRTQGDRQALVKVGTVTITLAFSDEVLAVLDVDDVRHKKILERAEIIIYRVIVSTLNFALIFQGTLGVGNVTNERVVVQAKDYYFTMLKNLPGDIYGQSCNWNFGGDECTLDLNALKVNGTAESGSDTDTLVDAINLTDANDYFNRGYVEMLTGNNAGLKRQVITYVTGTLTLLRPFPVAIDIGDTFDVFPFCEKQFSNCDGKFSNTENSLIFRHMATEEQVYG